MTLPTDHGTAAHTAAGDHTDAPGRAFLVVYLDEARRRVIELAEDVEVTFGRSRASTVMIDDDLVSRSHTRIVLRDGRIVVEDLGSRNGTRVNGARIEGPVVVESGDAIGVGPTLVVVGVAGAPRRAIAAGGTSYLDERLAAEVDRSTRYHRQIALLMVRVEGTPSTATTPSIAWRRSCAGWTRSPSTPPTSTRSSRRSSIRRRRRSSPGG